MSGILDRIHGQEDVRKLSHSQSQQLSKEIRSFLVDSVSKTGGHLSANLGVVELTIALLQVFDPDQDKIVFDVGHQTYVYKMLTGRKERFSALRQYQGLSGFPNPEESPYDLFYTGHATTSISSAYGLAKARDLKQENYHVVSVIGDGSMTGGMAYEAMNNAGKDRTPFIVVLNDNEMSINKNVGSLPLHLARLRTKRGYLSGKRKLRRLFESHPALQPLYRALDTIKDRIKYLMVKGILFEEMGFVYLGPVDGHDIEAVKELLSQAKNLGRPCLVHVITKKGKGYAPAENHPDWFHGVGPFDPETGKPLRNECMTYADIFGRRIKKLEERDKNVVVVTAAMQDGTGIAGSGLDEKRLFDVGIAEEHAVTFAGGLARGGMKPFVAIYSSFLQRAYDQILQDVCLQNLPVVFMIDHSGVVGDDGVTHQGLFDLAYLCHIPNMVVMAPSCQEDMEAMIEAAYQMNCPVAIRYPKGKAISIPERKGQPLEYTVAQDGKHLARVKGLIVHRSASPERRVCLLALGAMVEQAKEASRILQKEGIDVSLVDARFASPLPVETLAFAYVGHDLVITLEDHIHQDGFGVMVEAFAKEQGWRAESLNLSLPDGFLEHDTRSHTLERFELNAASVAARVRNYYHGKLPKENQE